MTQEDFYKRYAFDPKKDKLGRGAFGKVFKAYDTVRNRQVAIKIAEVVEIGGKSMSLQDELDAIGDLPDHTNIAHYEDVYQFDTLQGQFDYAVMQFYSDGSLDDLISKNENLSHQNQSIALGILNGIHFLHSHNVTHRDLKPANILIVNHNDKYIPKITDFGLSKKHDSNKSRFTNSFGGGTLAYSSPEQLKGQILRNNTDLWSWATIVYELFTGQRLFDQKRDSNGSAERENRIYNQILEKNISKQLFLFPDQWKRAIERCLERDPEKRVKSAEEIFEILGVTPELAKTNNTSSANSKINTSDNIPIDETLETVVRPIDKKEAANQTFVASKPNKKTAQPLKSTKNVTKPKKKSKLPFILGGLGLVAVLGYFGLNLGGKGLPTVSVDYEQQIDQDSLAFTQVDLLSKSSLSKYIKANGSGPYVDKAIDHLDQLSLIPCEGKGGWGYLSPSFDMKVSFKYDEALPFSGGLAAVKKNGKWGFVDKSGRNIIQLKFKDVGSFYEGLARVSDASGYEGYIDKTGMFAIPCQYDDAGDFSEGLAIVKRNGYNGFVDKTGKLVIPYKYDQVLPFKDEYAAVRKNGLWGFIDKTDQLIIPCQYDVATSFENGLALVGNNGVYGCINKEGSYVLGLEFSTIGPLRSGLIKAERKNGLTGYFDQKGNEVITAQYDDAYDFVGNIAPVKLGGRWGFIDKTGKFVIRPKYDKAKPFSDGMSLVKLGRKYGYVNYKGQEVTKPKFYEGTSFDNGFGKVSLNREPYYINKSGNLFKREVYSRSNPEYWDWN